MSKMRFGVLLLKLILLNVCLIRADIRDNVCNWQTSSNKSALLANMYPILYEVMLTPNFNAENRIRIDGRVNITISVISPTNEIKLHAEKMTIFDNEVKLIRFKDNKHYTPRIFQHKIDEQTLYFLFTDVLSPDYYVLSLRFMGHSLKDTYVTSHLGNTNIDEGINKEWFATTLVKPTMARRLFPCWNEPDVKAEFDIHITHPTNIQVLSNAPVLETGSEKGNVKWTHFHNTPLMLTSQLMIAFTNYFNCLVDAKIAMCAQRKIKKAQLKHLMDIVEKMNEFLSRYTNYTTYYFTNYLVVPNLPVPSIESLSLRVYSEQDVIYDETLDDINSKLDKMLILARGMTCQFFIDEIAASTWGHLWINRAIGSYLAHYTLNEIYPHWRVMEFYVVRDLQLALEKDVDFQVRPTVHNVDNSDEIDEYYSSTNYIKDTAIMRMLQHILTDEVFQLGIEKYAHIYKRQGTASTNEFLKSLIESSDENGKVIDDLCETINTWLTQRGYPIVTVVRNYVENEVEITQRHVDRQFAEYSAKWFIPITYTVQSRLNFSTTSAIKWLRPHQESIKLYRINKYDWIILNLQQVGYYRVNYDVRNWNKIGSFLNSAEYSQIHVLNRAQLIDDAYYFMTKGELIFPIFIDIIRYLKQETDYLPWYTVQRIFLKMTDILKLPVGNLIKPHLLEILNGLVEKVGYEENKTDDNNTKLTRLLALKWACRFGNDECKTIANNKLNKHMARPTMISSSWKKWIYCAGMMTANISTAEKLLNQYKVSRNEELLEYFACSENDNVTLYYLKSISEEEDYGSSSHKLYDAIIREHADKEAVLHYILTNLMELQSIQRNVFEKLLHITSYVCKEDNLRKLRDYKKYRNLDIESKRKLELAIEHRLNEIAKKQKIFSDHF